MKIKAYCPVCKKIIDVEMQVNLDAADVRTDWEEVDIGVELSFDVFCTEHDDWIGSGSVSIPGLLDGEMVSFKYTVDE